MCASRRRVEDIKAIRVAAGGADLILGCDMVVAGSARMLAAIDPGHTRVFVNTHETYPGDFTHDPDCTLPTRRIVQAITARAGAARSRFIEATEIATALLGDAIAANMFMLGLAWQAGGVPLVPFRHPEGDRDERRRCRDEPRGLRLGPARGGRAGRGGSRSPPSAPAGAACRWPRRVEELAARRTRFLTEYQDERYAQRYADTVSAMHEAEARVAPGRADLTDAVARNLFRLMAIKDEYEVARLFTDGTFERQLANSFDELGQARVPPRAAALRQSATSKPAIAGRRPTGRVWCACCACWRAIGGCAASWLDPFGYTAERRMERRLLADYEATLGTRFARPCRRRTTIWPWRSPAIRRRFGAMATSRPTRSCAPCRTRPSGARRFWPAAHR